MLAEAVLPPSKEHSYAQWLERTYQPRESRAAWAGKTEPLLPPTTAQSPGVTCSLPIYSDGEENEHVSNPLNSEVVLQKALAHRGFYAENCGCNCKSLKRCRIIRCVYLIFLVMSFKPNYILLCPSLKVKLVLTKPPGLMI